MTIENFELIEQKHANTCGYASAAMIINYFEDSRINEDFLLENEPLDKTGITFSKLTDVYSKYLTKAKAEIIYDNKNNIHEMIIKSLNDNCPLQILHLTQNKFDNMKPVLHYAVLSNKE